MRPVGVAIASNARCPELLRHLVVTWVRLGAHVAVAGRVQGALSWSDPQAKRVTVIDMDDAPKTQGDQIAAAFEALDPHCDFILRTDDDVLPIGPHALAGAWLEGLELSPGSIRAVRLLDLRGRRWFDWARRTGEGAFVQPYDQHGPRTYITGACQLWSREAREAVSYRNRPYRTGADAQICEDAEAAGIRLLPPDPDGPTLLHLDRKPSQIHRI